MRSDKLKTSLRRYTDDGKAVTYKNFDARKHWVRWTPKEREFLLSWRNANWDMDKAIFETQVTPEWATRFIERTTAKVWRWENEYDVFLSKVPNKDYVIAKFFEIAEGMKEVTDSQKWALERIKDILIPKTAAIQQTNVFARVELNPERLQQLLDTSRKLSQNPDVEIVDG